MYRHHHWVSEEQNREDVNRQTASLAGVAVVLLILIGGLFLVQHLRTSAQIEDCLMAGRRDCDALVVSRN